MALGELQVSEKEPALPSSAPAFHLSGLKRRGLPLSSALQWGASPLKFERPGLPCMTSPGIEVPGTYNAYMYYMTLAFVEHTSSLFPWCSKHVNKHYFGA